LPIKNKKNTEKKPKIIISVKSGCKTLKKKLNRRNCFRFKPLGAFCKFFCHSWINRFLCLCGHGESFFSLQQSIRREKEKERDKERVKRGDKRKKSRKDLRKRMIANNRKKERRSRKVEKKIGESTIYSRVQP
jgi:hypothetical protein